MGAADAVLGQLEVDVSHAAARVEFFLVTYVELLGDSKAVCFYLPEHRFGVASGQYIDLTGPAVEDQALVVQDRIAVDAGCLMDAVGLFRPAAERLQRLVTAVAERILRAAPLYEFLQGVFLDAMMVEFKDVAVGPNAPADHVLHGHLLRVTAEEDLDAVERHHKADRFGVVVSGLSGVDDLRGRALADLDLVACVQVCDRDLVLFGQGDHFVVPGLVAAALLAGRGPADVQPAHHAVLDVVSIISVMVLVAVGYQQFGLPAVEQLLYVLARADVVVSECVDDQELPIIRLYDLHIAPSGREDRAM